MPVAKQQQQPYVLLHSWLSSGHECTWVPLPGLAFKDASVSSAHQEPTCCPPHHSISCTKEPFHERLLMRNCSSITYTETMNNPHTHCMGVNISRPMFHLMFHAAGWAQSAAHGTHVLYELFS